MKKFYSVSIIFFLLFGFLSISHVHASTINGININLNVTSCNNNGTCELGEDFLSCPSDCEAPPPPPPDTPPSPPGTPPSSSSSSSSGGGVVYTDKDFFRNLTVIPNYTSAIIKWNSAVPTIYVLKWGSTPEYKNGSLKNVHFVNDHSVEITGLESGKNYYFSIEGESYNGMKNNLYNQTFSTLLPVDKISPSNPTNVIATTTLSGIVLSWVNPSDKDFDYLRITRNEIRYNSDPYQGKLVYEGNGQYFRDTDVTESIKYFYTIFARDRQGNYSTGYPISITHNPPKDGIVKTGPEVKEDIGTGASSVSPIPSVTFYIVQNEAVKEFTLGSTSSVDGDLPFAVKVEFKEKSIDDLWVQISDTDRKVLGRFFLGKQNSDSMIREVLVPPLEGNGYYYITVLGYFESVEKVVNEGGLEVKSSERISDEGAPLYYGIGLWLLVILIFIILFISIKKIIIVITRKRKKKTTDEVSKSMEMENHQN